MPKKENSPNISFFSFQDIITSLTGIMFLIVLLLVIFLLDAGPRQNASDAEEYRELQQTLKRNRELLDACRQEIARREERKKELDALDLNTIQQRLRKEEEALQRAEASCYTAQQEYSQLQREIPLREEAIQKKEAQAAAAQQNTAQLAEEMRRLLKEKKLLQKKRELNAKTIHFAIENQTPAKPVLVECRKEGIRILNVETKKETDLRVPQESCEQQMERFSQWLKTRSGASEYYTFLVAPGAFEYARLPLAMQDMGIGRGLEFLPADDYTIFPGDEK